MSHACHDVADVFKIVETLRKFRRLVILVDSVAEGECRFVEIVHLLDYLLDGVNCPVSVSGGINDFPAQFPELPQIMMRDIVGAIATIHCQDPFNGEFDLVSVYEQDRIDHKMSLLGAAMTTFDERVAGAHIATTDMDIAR